MPKNRKYFFYFLSVSPICSLGLSSISVGALNYSIFSLMASLISNIKITVPLLRVSIIISALPLCLRVVWVPATPLRQPWGVAALARVRPRQGSLVAPAAWSATRIWVWSARAATAWCSSAATRTPVSWSPSRSSSSPRTTRWSRKSPCGKSRCSR